MKTNSRNTFGVKDSINCYLNIKGKFYTQFSDCQTIEECKKEYPAEKFIARKQKEGFIRIYRQA